MMDIPPLIKWCIIITVVGQGIIAICSGIALTAKALG